MIDRRTFFRSAATATGVAAVAGGATAIGSAALTGPTGAGAPGAAKPRWSRFDRPLDGFAPAGTTLRRSDPRRAGLDPRPIEAALDRIEEWTRPDEATGHPLFSGAVSMLVHDGQVVRSATAGQALRYADAKGTELPKNEQIPMREDTIFDMASISKLFTSIVALQLIERGKLAVDRRVAEYLPAYGNHGKEEITVRQLLTHTSGLEPFIPLWQDWPDVASRRQAVLDVAVTDKPGTTYVYSDLNMISLQLLAEHLTGKPLDALVRDGITTPLGLADTGYNPAASTKRRIAATEYQTVPERGLTWGIVHDENAWSLGGVAGHAGVFSTARDLAVLGQTILNGGTYAGKRILKQETVETMLVNYNQQFPEDSHGLGFELNQMWYMGALASPVSAGHTGFTGTALVIDPLSRSVSILLTNRVHPSREWGSINEARQTLATGLALAMAVPPAQGRTSWFSPGVNQAGTTLSTQGFRAGKGELAVSARVFLDTEPTDTLTMEISRDGGEWQAVPVRASGPGAPKDGVDALSGNGHRAWWKVSATMPNSAASTEVRLRWRYTTDEMYRGRGVQVDAIRVVQGEKVLFDGERDRRKFVADGWREAAR